MQFLVNISKDQKKISVAMVDPQTKDQDQVLMSERTDSEYSNDDFEIEGVYYQTTGEAVGALIQQLLEKI